MCVCFWSPVSIPCLNSEVLGLQPQVVAILKPGLCASPQYIFKPPYAKDACQIQDETNKGQKMGTFMTTSVDNHTAPLT